MSLSLLLSSAITWGLITSFHCIGMCGPIALALPLNKNSKTAMVISSLFYNVGRAFTYAIFGFIFGLIGLGFQMSGFQQWASIVMGVIMILSVLFPALFKNSFNIEKWSYSFVIRIQTKLRKLFQSRSFGSLFLIGLLNGLLPCGPVYVALFGAIGTGGAMSGALFMFIFGLGTIPMMFAITIFGNIISGQFRNRINKIAPYIVVIIGLLFILRGANLGIPYISPKDKMLVPREKMMKKTMHAEKILHLDKKFIVF